MCFDEENLELYMLRRLSDQDAEAVEDHLVFCPKCQDQANEIKQAVEAITLGLREQSEKASVKLASVN
jgi:anti-sigma factor RsiW